MGEHADQHMHEIVLAERNKLRQENADLKAALARSRRRTQALLPCDPDETGPGWEDER